MEFGVRPHLLRGRVTHLYGPARVDYAPDELLVITVVRNGALYVRVVHGALPGARRPALCVSRQPLHRRHRREICAHISGVTVLQTDAPYEKFENTMKRYLAERFSPDRWNLCADIDELFDYPFARELPISGFLGYLNQRRFTAVVAQMLDMFSELPLGEIESSPDDRLMDTYTYYDISAIDKHPVRVVRSAETRGRDAPGRHPADRVRDEQWPHEGGTRAHGWQGETIRRVASGQRGPRWPTSRVC